MKKFVKEFKAFVTRGKVIDLAVGVIVGGAFTAIVTALTNNILRPFINWIIYLCGGGKGIAAYTFLIGSAEDMSTAIYIDWGAFISAIINFILIALVLFLIIKAINKAQSGLGKVKRGFLILLDPEVRALRKEGKTWAEIHTIDQARSDEKKAAEEAKAAAAAEEAKANDPATILKEIRDLLKEQKQ